MLFRPNRTSSACELVSFYFINSIAVFSVMFSHKIAEQLNFCGNFRNVTYYIPMYLYMLNFPLPSGNIGQFFVLKKAQSCDYAKFHIIRVFGTASISLVGFAHTRSFQDGDQKHGKMKSNRI